MPSTQAAWHLSDFDYDLPANRIARYPLDQRDASKMMVVDRPTDTLQDNLFTHIIDYLNPGDVLIGNNAKVIPARLLGHREGHTGQVELLLLNALEPTQHQWEVLMKPARRLTPGTQVVFDHAPGFVATIMDRKEAGHGTVDLIWPDDVPFEVILAQVGVMPIPPYLNRAAEAADTERYQTVFAANPGAQAAPTAGLHFTPTVLDQLKAKGIIWQEITLNVSAGTFRPVLDEEIDAHQMDPEYYTLPPETVEAILKAKAHGNRIIAVGTTVLKTLETAAQKYPTLQPHSAWSDLFIRPGFNFQLVDALLTNFHLPKSTLLMLVSAFASHNLIMQAYHHAIEANYRFYSYGDCMLIQ